MKMEIPKFDDTFIPILEVLKDGRVLRSRELIEEVKVKFYSKLSEDQLKQKQNLGIYL